MKMKKQQPNSLSPFFNGEYLYGQAKPRYVCWLDLMGANNRMAISLPQSVNFVMKIHIAALSTDRTSAVELYPVIDGVYFMCENQKDLLKAVAGSLNRLAVGFISEGTDEHRFLVRAGLSFGRTLRGCDAVCGSDVLKENADYIKPVAVGIAISQAYAAERSAPPFGVFLHESVRSAAPIDEKPMSGVFWQWWKMLSVLERGSISELPIKIDSYFEWVHKNRRRILYPEDRLKEHSALATEYFQDWQIKNAD